MQECVVAVDFAVLDELNAQLIAAAFLVSVILRHTKHAIFCFVLLAFYWFAVTFHCHIKALDPGIAGYRYMAWSMLDIALLLSLFILAKAKWIQPRALAFCIALESVAISCHVLRALDNLATGGEITDLFYPEAIALTNVGFVLLATVPVICYIINKRK